jgi:hypothetical protein
MLNPRKRLNRYFTVSAPILKRQTLLTVEPRIHPIHGGADRSRRADAACLYQHAFISGRPD